MKTVFLILAVSAVVQARQYCEWNICPSSVYPLWAEKSKPPPECVQGRGFLDANQQTETFVRLRENVWYSCEPKEDALKAGKVTQGEIDIEEGNKK